MGEACMDLHQLPPQRFFPLVPPLPFLLYLCLAPQTEVFHLVLLHHTGYPIQEIANWPFWGSTSAHSSQKEHLHCIFLGCWRLSLFLCGYDYSIPQLVWITALLEWGPWVVMILWYLLCNGISTAVFWEVHVIDKVCMARSHMDWWWWDWEKNRKLPYFLTVSQLLGILLGCNNSWGHS